MKKVCPNCGSCEIDYASMRTDSGGVVGIGVSERYYCPDCGYKGSVILEVADDAKCPVRKPYHEKKRERSAEVLKPVYVMVLLLFLLTAVVLMIPKYDLSKEKIPAKLDVSRSTEGIYEPRTVTIIDTPVTIIQAEPSKLEYIDGAMGIKADLLVQLFYMFFVTGFIALMICSHWKRVKIFW